MSIASDALGECDAYCEHGGVCVRKEGHKGKHNSGYCTWSDEKSLSKKDTNDIIEKKMKAQGIMGIELIKAFTYGLE